MPAKSIATLAYFTFLSTSAFSASSIELEVGELKDSDGATVTSGTWVLILDANNDQLLPGNIAATTTSNNAHLLLANATAASSDFSGITLNLGQLIGGARIHALGAITDADDEDYGPGFGVSGVTFAAGEEGLAYGIYWFPGITQGSTLPTSGTFQVGGFFQSTTGSFAPTGTFSPPSPLDNIGTAFDSSAFNAITVNAVPEPSTFLLSAFGVLALLRRSRKG
jgi:hypothetical protein